MRIKALQLTRHCSDGVGRGTLVQHHRGSADIGSAVPRS